MFWIFASLISVGTVLVFVLLVFVPTLALTRRRSRTKVIIKKSLSTETVNTVVQPEDEFKDVNLNEEPGPSSSDAAQLLQNPDTKDPINPQTAKDESKSFWAKLKFWKGRPKVSYLEMNGLPSDHNAPDNDNGSSEPEGPGDNTKVKVPKKDNNPKILKKSSSNLKKIVPDTKIEIPDATDEGDSVSSQTNNDTSCVCNFKFKFFFFTG